MAVALRGLLEMMAISPKNSPGPEHGEDLLHVAHLLGDGDLPRLKDEHLLAGLALAEEDGALRELLAESLEEGFFGAHRRAS